MNKKQKTIEKQSKPELKIKHKKTDQAHLVLGFRGYNMFHPDRFALALLANILGGTMSSRLFLVRARALGAGLLYQRVRTKNLPIADIFPCGREWTRTERK